MQSNLLPSEIQNFNLFGEAKTLPDVVHCESIYARSSLNNWEFSPHRHAHLHQVLLIEAGNGRAEIDGRACPLVAGSVVNVPMACVHAFSFAQETEGWVVTLGEEILFEALKETEGLQQVFGRAVIFDSTNEIKDIIRNIAKEHADLKFGRAHILRAMSGQLIGQVARAISRVETNSSGSQENPLRRQFSALLDVHFSNHWGVVDYAKALNVTPGHLTRSLRQSTGMSTSAIIETRIALEARRYLAYTNLTISEIGYALGFNDPAYFSRVFTRTTGKSPRKFRTTLEKSGR